MPSNDAKMLIIVTTGREDGGKRATLAFSAGCCSAAMGMRTRIFLVGDGADWGFERDGGRVQHAGFPPLDELMESFIEAGGEALICSACHEVCVSPQHAGGPAVRRPGFAPAGMASVLGDMDGATSLTF